MQITPNKREIVNFLDQKDAILAKVAEHGEIAEMETWFEAFPHIDFCEFEDVEWDEYSPVERAVYIAYALNPQAANLLYTLDTSDAEIHYGIEYGETIWECWISHVFVFLDEGKIIDYALETLMNFATFGQTNEDGEDLYDLIMDDEYAYIESMKFRHQKVDL